MELVGGIPEPVGGVVIMASPELMKIVECGCSSDAACLHRNCSCYSDDLSCTSYCKCSAESQCNNPNTAPLEDHDVTISSDEDE